jgi:hypothetical protein
MSYMNFSFLTPNLGLCRVKLWATGRYGFSLPKKVEITTAAGATSTFLYYNRKVGLTSELANRALVRIAITQFLERDPDDGAVVEINDTMPPFAGTLTPVRPSAPAAAPTRVRPGRLGARTSPGKQSGVVSSDAASSG